MTLDELLNASNADLQVFVRARVKQACIRAPGDAEWTSFTSDTPAHALRLALESRLPATAKAAPSDDDDLI